jgi:cobalamin biosynthesis protein CobD/CbiB
MVDLPKMGDGPPPQPEDIARALQLYRATLLTIYAAVAVVAVLVFR